MPLRIWYRALCASVTVTIIETDLFKLEDHYILMSDHTYESQHD